MISTRGPNKLRVLDRNAVKVNEVCSWFIRSQSISDTCTRFNISEDELVEIINNFVDELGPNSQDFISMEIFIDRNGQIDISTAGISDWAVLCIFLLGYDLSKKDTLTFVYAAGLQSILISMLEAFINSQPLSSKSIIDNMVFSAFEEAFYQISQHELTLTEAEKFLGFLKKDDFS